MSNKWTKLLLSPCLIVNNLVDQLQEFCRLGVGGDINFHSCFFGGGGGSMVGGGPMV